MAEDVDVGGVEEVSVDIGGGASEEVATADGEDLAHGVASVENTVLVHIRCPNEILLLNKFNNDNIIGNTRQQFRKFLIEPTFLPNAPKHPLMPERGEIITDVFLVFSL